MFMIRVKLVLLLMFVIAAHKGALAQAAGG